MNCDMSGDNTENQVSSGDIHICGGCKLQFNSVKSFVIHKKDGCFDNQQVEKNCNEINDIQPNVEEKEKNNKSNTTEESAPPSSSKSNKRFHCEVSSCQYKTCYLKDLLRHNRTHTGEKPFSCSVCNKNFTRADKLKMHERWHTGVKPYKCKECDYATNDSGSLKKHLRVHSNERPFKCQICPYASRNSSQLVVHLRTHTGDSPFHCPICDTKFKINSDLKRHLRMHTGEKPYSCHLCDYKCAVKGNLKTHMKLNHNAENNQLCPHCDFTTSSRRVFREHEKTHDAKAVKCQQCPYTCTTRAALKNHQRIHSTERPFKCTFCSYSSRQPGNVRTHIKKRHLDKLNRQKKSTKRSNAVGDEGELSDIKRSPRSRPLCVKSFRCTMCDAAFVREDSLRSHLRQHNQRLKQLEGAATVAVLQLSNALVNDGSIENQTNEGSNELVDLGLQNQTVNNTNAQTQIIEHIYHNVSTSIRTPSTTTLSTCQQPTQVIAYIQNSNQDNALPTSSSILATLLKNNETVPSSSGSQTLTVDVGHPISIESTQASLNTLNLTNQPVSPLMYSLGILPVLSVNGQNIAHSVNTISNSLTNLVSDQVSGGIQYIVQTNSDNNTGSLLLNRIGSVDNNANQQPEGSELQLLTTLPPTTLARSDESNISTNFFNSAGLGSFLTPILVTSQTANQMQMTEIVSCNEQNNSDKNTKDCASMTVSYQGSSEDS